MGLTWSRTDSLKPQRELAEALSPDMSIVGLVREANQNARDKGFYDARLWDGDSYPGEVWNAYSHAITNEQLLHAVIEMGEAAQIFRKTGEFSPDLLEELGDVWIVLADLIGRYGLEQDFADTLSAKLAKNRARPAAYGNARAQADTSTPCCGEPGDCNDSHKGTC